MAALPKAPHPRRPSRSPSDIRPACPHGYALMRLSATATIRHESGRSVTAEPAPRSEPGLTRTVTIRHDRRRRGHLELAGRIPSCPAGTYMRQARRGRDVDVDVAAECRDGVTTLTADGKSRAKVMIDFGRRPRRPGHYLTYGPPAPLPPPPASSSRPHQRRRPRHGVK
jgi:hypothetical protein